MTLRLARASGAVPTSGAVSPSPAVLRRFPMIAAQLRARGIPPEPDEDETRDALENRLGTALMALYRDTRTERSFEALYQLSEASVLAWIRSLLARSGSQLDPIEILQDTFVNVFRYPKGFRDDHAGSYRVWVRTIAGNLIRRARGRQAAAAVQELSDGHREIADSGATPETNAVVGEEVRVLQNAWVVFLLHYARASEELLPRDRLALQLVEVEGRSYQEAGRILDVGRSNMKMIIFRARKRIAARMAHSMGALPVPARVESRAG